MGKKGNRKVEKAEEVVGKDPRTGELLRIPLCAKTWTPIHEDFLVPMPPPKNYRYFPSENFSMDRTHVLRSPDEAMDSNALDDSALTGFDSDADIVAARARCSKLIADIDCAEDSRVEVRGVDEMGQGLEDIQGLLGAMYEIEGSSDGSPVFIMEPLPEFPDIRFERLTPAEACDCPNHTRPVWVRPMKFTLQSARGLHYSLIVCNMHYFRIGAGPNLKANERRAIMEQAFWEASQSKNLQSVNALYLLFSFARDGAVKNKNEALCAQALLNYIEAIRAHCLFPTVGRDLVMFGMECGRMFEAASLSPECSPEQQRAYRHHAAVAFKQAAADSMRSAAIKPEEVCEAWNYFGQALFRAGDLPMSIRAYHWGLHVSRPLQLEQSTILMWENLVKLGKLRKEGSAAQEQVRTDGLRRIVEGERGGLPTIKHHRAGRCAICASAATLKCSLCKAVYYCSAACQKDDWRLHKRSCQGKAGVATGCQTGGDDDQEQGDAVSGSKD